MLARLARAALRRTRRPCGAGRCGAGIAATVAYGFKLDFYNDDYRNIVIAVFIGFAFGAVLAGIGWVLTRPLDGLKPDQAQEIFDTSVKRLTSALADPQ